MTRAKGAASRTAAVQAAQQAAASHRAALREREASLEKLLADFYQARAQAQQIRAEAEARAARLRQGAEAKATRLRQDAEQAAADLAEHAHKDAATYEQAAGDALRGMLQLGETRAVIAEMTGLSATEVRQAQHG